MELTHGHLLGGRVRYAQPRDFYRTGIEPVLLAAACRAQPGQRVLEAGCGAGAALLCLAARVPGLVATGVEIDPAMAELARQNVRDNGFDGIDIITGDITTLPPAAVHHAFANPPWHDPRSTASPVPQRQLATHGSDLERWIAALAAALQPGGCLTLILPATQLARAGPAIAQAGYAMSHRLLRPKPGRDPKLVLIQACRGNPAGHPVDIVLHAPDGSFTPAIEAVLRHGAAL